MTIDIAQVQHFHGHMCPGLAIGIRVAEQSLLEMGERPGDEEVVAIVETDNCAVDAIQFITGCTFGKGNLIHLDYGKNAFRFFRRKDGKAIRIRVKPDIWKPLRPDEDVLMKKWWQGATDETEKQEVARLHQQRTDYILGAPLAELLDVLPIQPQIPARACIFNSVTCAGCGEKTMETRVRLLEGKSYCPECFEALTKR